MYSKTHAFDDKLRDLYESTIHDPNTRKIRYPGNLISKRPIFSSDYFNCCACAVIGHGKKELLLGGLTHYQTSADSFANTREKTISFLSRFITYAQFPWFAVVVGGDQKLFKWNLAAMELAGIPVLGQYCDKWSVKISKEETSPDQSEKSVLVIPEQKKIIIYSEPIGIKSWNLKE